MTVGTRTSPTFAELLHLHRTAAGLTQEELAERARVSARAVSDLERGAKQRPHLHTVLQLIQALGLTEEEGALFQRAARGSASPRFPAQPAQSHSLPLQPTPFIGRKQEIEELAALLCREEVRLLTLTGPGGVGKTRLALRVAKEMQDVFLDGVVFVSLASLADAHLVPATIAAGLKITEGGSQRLLEQLIEHLREKRLLLLLDNFEHLLPAAGVVSQLLAACPAPTVLVTSRASLYLAAEREYPLPPFPTPAPGHVQDMDTLGQYDAIQLFLQRAQAIRPGFQMTEENASTIAEICSRLDGLPLAIELAAARVRLFPPQALLEHLTDRLQLLTGGPRDAPARQQTLRNTIDWSYGLLAPEEQTLFARLSVFAGGCTFEAAGAVCNASGDLNLLADMAALVDKNLLRQMGEEPRFAMLETIREYASERLEESGEADRVRRTHAVYLLDLARLALPDTETGAIPYHALDRLEREHDNLRVALAWAEDHDPDELGLPLAVTAASFWEIRDYYSESRQWIERMLARSTTPPGVLRARALYYLGSSSVYLGDYQVGLRYLEASLALYRTVDDRSSMILVLSVLGGCLATNLGRPAAAIPHLREAANLARLSGPPYRWHGRCASWDGPCIS